MLLMSRISALLAALIHVYFFVLESVLWGTPRVNAVFKVTAAQAEAARLMAYNQGFYNLFLAVGVFVGLLLLRATQKTIGNTLILFSCVCMLGAAIVLCISLPHMVRGYLVQGIPPLSALLLFILHTKSNTTV